MLINKAFALTSTFILIIVLFTNFTYGDKSEPQFDVEELSENVEIHDLNITQDTRSVEVQSTREDDSGDIFFKYIIKAEDKFYIRLITGVGDMKNASTKEIKINFLGIVEFFDNNYNGRFESENDPIASVYPLSNDIYFCNVFKDIKTFNNDSLKNITKEQFDQDLLEKYDYGYTAGYKNGFQLGLEEGEFDRENNNTFRNYYSYHIPQKEIDIIFNNVYSEFKQELEENGDSSSVHYLEMLELYRRGFWNGLSTGFKNGYEENYGPNPYPSFSNGYWSNYWGYKNGELYNNPIYWLARYNTLEVEQIENDGRTNDQQNIPGAV